MITHNLMRGLAAAAFGMTIALSASTALAAGSHGGGHGSAAIGEPGKADEVNRTVEVSMLDIYFEPESIEITRGETVRFVIVNDGEFVHEFNIGTADMHAEHQEEMMMMMDHGVLEADKINRERMQMDMGDGQTMAHDDPNSVLLEPGETAEVIWKFADPVELEFACNVPGHYESGMAGNFEFVTKQSSR